MFVLFGPAASFATILRIESARTFRRGSAIVTPFLVNTVLPAAASLRAHGANLGGTFAGIAPRLTVDAPTGKRGGNSSAAIP